MNTRVPIKTNKGTGGGSRQTGGWGVTGARLTGCGVALGSVDLTWRCVIIAWRRSLSFASCREIRTFVSLVSAQKKRMSLGSSSANVSLELKVKDCASHNKAGPFSNGLKVSLL